MTYFEVFSLPPKLGIDAAALEKAFYRLSREYHPDRFASKPADEQAAATEKSSLLNDAYRTLRDPIRRTEYLLETEGVELEEQSVKATESARASGTEKKQIVPPDLLEEAFELNMQLEEMKMAKTMGDPDDEEAAQLRRDLQGRKGQFFPACSTPPRRSLRLSGPAGTPPWTAVTTAQRMRQRMRWWRC